MTEKTKDILGYTEAAVFLLAAAILFYKGIYKPFYYGLGFGWTTILFGS